MNIKNSILLFLLIGSFKLFCQVNDDEIHQIVLKINITDTLYVFGQWNEKNSTETHLNYLGSINSPEGEFKIMTSIWFWGLSKRATSRILVFTKENEYLGNYKVGMTYDLPQRIENNKLVFIHSTDDECDTKTITTLSFENGIPKNFFLECKDGYGDIYTFENE